MAGSVGLVAVRRRCWSALARVRPSWAHRWNRRFYIRGSLRVTGEARAAREQRAAGVYRQRPERQDGDRYERIFQTANTAVERDLGDWFAFAIGAATTDLDGPPGGGARFPVACRLDGRVFAQFHVDVALGDGVAGRPGQLARHDFLGFAGISPTQLAVLPAAQHFAEKIHAYTFPWRDRPNTRVRDLVDLVLLIDTGLLEPPATVAVLRLTFVRRATHPLPADLPPLPEERTTPFSALPEEMKPAGQITEAAFARPCSTPRLSAEDRIQFNTSGQLLSGQAWRTISARCHSPRGRRAPG